MIKDIIAENFKGSSFKEHLSPVTQFYGPNFAGKSSRVEALTLALVGYLPGIPKTGAAIHRALASSAAMRVEAVPFSGPSFIRSYEASGKNGSVKTNQTDAVIEPVAIDASAYLSLSGPERIKFLFARAALPGEFQIASLRATIAANLKNIKLEANTADTEAAIEAMIAILDAEATRGGEPQAFIENLADAISEAKKTAVANEQRQEKTLQGLAQNTDLEAVDQDAEATMLAVQERLNAAKVALGELAAAGKGIRARCDKLIKAAEVASKITDPVEAANALERLSQEKQKLFTLTQTRPVSSEVARSAARKEMDAAARACAASDQELRRVRAELETTRATKVCTKCGQSVVKLKEGLIAALEKQVADLTLAAAPLHEALESATRAMSTAEADYNRQLQAVNEWMEKSSQFRQLSQQHAELQDALAGYEAAKAAMAERTQAEQELEVTRAKYTEQQGVVAELEKAYAAAVQDSKRLIAQRANEQTRAAVRNELTRARAEVAITKQATSLLAELQVKLVNAAIEPLVQAANELCAPILRSPIVWQDGDIGMISPITGRFVSHASFSGTERALAYAAISVALAAATRTMRIVILDEMGRLDKDNRRLLVQTLCNLYEAKRIDQAILIDTDYITCENKNFEAIPVHSTR